MFVRIGQLFFVAILLIASTGEASHHEPQHIKDLRELLEAINSSVTGYVKEGKQVDWPVHGHGASCFTDSSGLVNALLQHSYNLTESDYQKWLGKETPEAQDYYRAVISKHHFQRLENVTDLAPGDFIVIRFPKEIAGEGDATGYIGIVDHHATSTLEQTRPFVPLTQQWVVDIIDCVSKGHDSKDSRYLSKGQYYPGLGRGKMRLYIDTKGVVVGFTWGPSGLVYYPGTVYPIITGRYIK